MSDDSRTITQRIRDWWEQTEFNPANTSKWRGSEEIDLAELDLPDEENHIHSARVEVGSDGSYRAYDVDGELVIDIPPVQVEPGGVLIQSFDPDDNEYYTKRAEPFATVCCEAVVEVPTPYGLRRTCTVHRKLWTRLVVGGVITPWVEERYSGFGVEGR